MRTGPDQTVTALLGPNPASVPEEPPGPMSLDCTEPFPSRPVPQLTLTPSELWATEGMEPGPSLRIMTQEAVEASGASVSLKSTIVRRVLA